MAVKIPADIVRLLNLHQGSKLIIEISREGIVIKPERSRNLDELLDRITPENLHSEVDWGKREGNEPW
ncbi:suppressor of ppGpp-regulated growth inhibitor (ChpA/MazF) [Hydrogenivirga sp. 128-5-R1-1]|nr:suppressor of ppGpp-regulated growth inhibitor (ChpA/MazF) [Hydrogenivirga sp. 128-5-R1-1]